MNNIDENIKIPSYIEDVCINLVIFDKNSISRNRCPYMIDTPVRMYSPFYYILPYYTYITGHVINANEPGRVN